MLSCTPTEKPAADTNPEVSELQQQIGQMVMAGFRGKKIDDIDPSFLQQIETGYIGGVIFFDRDVLKKTTRNIESPAQVKQLIQDLQAKAKTPLFVAIDQEGGRVNRLKPIYGFPTSVSAQHLGSIDQLDSTRHYAIQTASTLNDLGFNVNFAPVVDVNVNPKSPAIGNIERSFSADPAEVIEHASLVAKVQDSFGIISTLKHFPGHGSATNDSHKGVTDITNTWSRAELQPFETVSKVAPSVAIMTAHVVNKNIDSLYPATMSKKIIGDILRKELNFSGLVFSDDLQMDAVNAMYDLETIIEQSIKAGVDVFVIGNNLKSEVQAPERVVQIIDKLVQEGKISKERIQASYDRIITYKKRMK